MTDPRKLEVWKRAHRPSIRIDQLVRDLPPAEASARRDQMGRSSGSIPYNISEGKGLDSDRLLSKHLRYALGSAHELQDQLEELAELDLLPERDQDLLKEIIEIRKMIAGLKATVDRDIERARHHKKSAAPKAPRHPNRSG